MRATLSLQVEAKVHDKAYGVMFHHFWDDTHPKGQGAISADEFDAMIHFVGKDRIVSAHEWYERARDGKLRGHEICLTFDDALRCQYDVAQPVMESHGLTAFWFVYTSPIAGNIERLEVYRHFRTTAFDSVDAFYDAFFEVVESGAFSGLLDEKRSEFDPKTYLGQFPFYTDSDRWFRFVRDEVLGPDRYNATMDEMVLNAGLRKNDLLDQLWLQPNHLVALKESGHVIGLHSHTHPTRMERLAKADQENEFSTNRSVLAEVLGETPKSMSHPCNSYNADTLSLLDDMGIEVGFRANMTEIDAPGPLEHPREDHANVLRSMQA